MTDDGVVGLLTTEDYRTFQVRNEAGDILAEFQGAARANKAYPGDTVEYSPSLQSCRILSRCIQPLIVGILELAGKTKYGMTSRGSPMYLFTPCDKQFPFMIVGCSTRIIQYHQLALVRFAEWDTTGLPRGELIRLLGPCGSREGEQEAIFRTYNPFKDYKLRNSILLEESEAVVNQRVDTPPLTFNIDPLGCRDVDDVLSLVVDEKKQSVELWITISDVSAFVEQGTELDEAAFQQGATAYLNGEAVRPMLPAEYSEDCCSLLPEKERLGVSLILEYKLGDYKTPRSKRFQLSRVHNRATFTYESFVEEAPKAGIDVGLLQTIASDLLGKHTADTHEWIEACMLTYNLEVAAILRSVGMGILRNHEMADMERLKQYELWGGKVLSLLANKSAQYCSATHPTPFHWGLTAKVYCHATSPIRRYADLYNQRVLKWHLLGLSVVPPPVNLHWLNQRQKAIKRYERDAFFLDLLLQSKTRTVSALILNTTACDDGRQKYKLWISDWKRLVTWKTAIGLPATCVPGVTVSLAYLANPAKRMWKDSIVFQFKDVASTPAMS